MKIARDFSARHAVWDSVSKGRGTAIKKFTVKINYVISPPSRPSFHSKGQKVWSKPDLLLYKEISKVNHRSEKVWDNTSDHTPITYTIYNVLLGVKRHRRLTKTIPANR